MSVGKKFLDHLFTTPAKSMTDGIRAGQRIAKDLGGSDGAEIAASLTGMLIGAVLGGVRLISPSDIAQTAMRSDGEIDRRFDNSFKDL